MRSLLLMYNLPESKRAKLRVLCMRLGAKMREVSPEYYEVPISELTGDELPNPTAVTKAPFDEEMIVMCGFNEYMLDAFLKGMRTSRIPVIPLKAVLTEENALWDSHRLHSELSAEREAIRQGKKAHEQQ